MADRLADRLSAHFRDKMKVTRPRKFGEVRIRGLVASVARGDVLSSLTACGKCRQEDVRIGDFRLSPAGIGTVGLGAVAIGSCAPDCAKR